MTISKELSNNSSEIEKLARQTETGQRWLGDKAIRKTILAKKGELVNFVI